MSASLPVKQTLQFEQPPAADTVSLTMTPFIYNSTDRSLGFMNKPLTNTSVLHGHSNVKIFENISIQMPYLMYTINR